MYREYNDINIINDIRIHPRGGEDRKCAHCWESLTHDARNLWWSSQSQHEEEWT